MFKRAHESTVFSQTTVITKISSAPQQRHAIVKAGFVILGYKGGWLASSRNGDSMMGATFNSSNH